MTPPVQPLFRPGEWVAGCQIVRSVGRGGMAEVFEVRYGRERQALKVSRPDSIVGIGVRMTREAELLKAILHPNLVEVFDHGLEPGGLLWIRMALLEGRTLRELIHERARRRSVISVPVAIGYLFRAAQGACQCHELGIVHRDIKPENIMVIQEGSKHQVKLLDLGMAKVLGSGQTSDLAPVGTLLYMAPEQFDPRLRVSPATDVYALSVMLYEMLAGHPFVPEDGVVTYPKAAFQHCYVVPPPLASFGIPASISAVVARGLSKHPDERYADGGAFADALWAAWEVVQAADPEVDTNPGEPSIDRILPTQDQGVEFGLAPPGRPRRRRSSLPVPAVARASAEALPATLQDPAQLDAAMERESMRFVPPPLPPEAEASRATLEVDGEQLRALVERTREARLTLPLATPFVFRAAQAEPRARPFVPVQHTEPLARPTEPAPLPPRALVPVQPTQPLPASPRPASPSPRPAVLSPVARETRGSSAHPPQRPAMRGPIDRVVLLSLAVVVALVWVVAAVTFRRASAVAETSPPAVSSGVPAPAACSRASAAEAAVPSASPAAASATSAPPAPAPLPRAAPAAPKPSSASRPTSELVDPWER